MRGVELKVGTDLPRALDVVSKPHTHTHTIHIYEQHTFYLYNYSVVYTWYLCMCVCVCCVVQAIEQIETSGGESVRVILVITDGTWVGLIKHRVRPHFHTQW